MLFADEGNLTRAFKRYFGFDPDRMRESRFRQEAMFQLAITAEAVEAKARTFQKTDDVFDKWSYHARLRKYDVMRDLIEHHYPPVKGRIPHWSAFKDDAEQWRSGNWPEVAEAAAPTPLLTSVGR
jgi:hypothetical protein